MENVWKKTAYKSNCTRSRWKNVRRKSRVVNFPHVRPNCWNKSRFLLDNIPFRLRQSGTINRTAITYAAPCVHVNFPDSSIIRRGGKKRGVRIRPLNRISSFRRRAPEKRFV